LIFGEKAGLALLYVRIYDMISNYLLLAVPLFIFMGMMMEQSGIAEKLYDALYLWLGGLKGGLAIATVLIGTVIAACVGVLTASVGMLALVALPSMIKRGYDKRLATGCVCAGGTLGILIPPSVMLVLYGPAAEVSVGRLFMGAFLPGLLLSALYCIYIGVLCFLKPKLGPSVPAEERKASFLKKTMLAMAALLPTSVIIFAVLGSIFLGIAAPTEAAAVGAFASVLLALFYRRLNWKVLRQTALVTVRICGMCFLMVAGSTSFSAVFVGGGGGIVVRDLLLAIPFGKWGVFGSVMLIVFILGMFIDWVGIVLIAVPIFSPIVLQIGFDPIWFALMVCLNLQTAFLTPPFAPVVFLVSGLGAREGVTTMDVIFGVIPFIMLILFGIVLCAIFPQIALWLPSLMIR
jgi:tripartite ATP-independent transporter DctM subunit